MIHKIAGTRTSAEVRLELSDDGNHVYVYQGNADVEPLILDQQQARLLILVLTRFTQGMALD
jgi:hypothetical protein